MKLSNNTLNTILLVSLVLAFCLADTLATMIYFRHEAIVHLAARYETSSWGTPSFHWNDDSAQTPFMNFSTNPADRLTPQ